jgi:hypothetical protein
MNSYAARAVYPCTVPYNIKLYTVLHVALADYRPGACARGAATDPYIRLEPGSGLGKRVGLGGLAGQIQRQRRLIGCYTCRIAYTGAVS